MKKGIYYLLCFKMLLFFGAANAQKMTVEDLEYMYNKAVTTIPAREAFDLYHNIIRLGESMGDSARKTVEVAWRRLPSAYYNVGAEAFRFKQKHAALSYFEESLELAKAYEDGVVEAKLIGLLPQLYADIAKDHQVKHKNDSALVYCEKALALNPYYSTALLTKSLVYKDAKDDAKAAELLEQAFESAGVENNMNVVNAIKDIFVNEYTRYAEQANNAKKPEEALEWANKALPYAENKQHQTALIHYEMGRSYKQLGNKTLACEYYQKASVINSLREFTSHEINQVLKCNQ